MPLSSRRLRDLLRIIHIGAAFATCAFVYSPFAGEPGFESAMQVVFVPVLAVTGGTMWQLHRLRGLIGRSAGCR